VAYHEPADAPLPKAADATREPEYLAGDEGMLQVDALIQEVQAVNPSLEAAVEAWHAAAQRYPQMVSLEDPMFGFMKGTWGGWMAEASQKIPWPGKLRLRGNVAAAEADAAQWDVEDTRLMLAEAAAMAFYDYYQADRQLAVNSSNTALMQQFRETAKVRYEAAQVSQQDVLQADVELADLEARHAELRQERKTAAARINTLLHREADHPLAPPPNKVAVPDALPARESLAGLALEARPDLAAQMARIRQEEYGLALAYKDYYPDVEIAAKHDHFMPMDMQNQVGMNFNVPIYRQKRHAAVCEASAKLRQRRAELEARIDQVRFEVESAWDRVSERRTVVRLYEQKILPAAEANVQSARINYTAGKVDFLRLVEAERQLREQQDKYHGTVAEYHRRMAQLQRAVGGGMRDEG
jgi:outer membrane protein TolC